MSQGFLREVGIAYRHFPIERLHPHAVAAANAAECAGVQGLFREYHDALYAEQSTIGRKPWGVQAHGLVQRVEAVERNQLVFEVFAGHWKPSRPGIDGTGALLRTALNGADVDSILRFKGEDALVELGRYRYPLVLGAPFAREPHWDVGPRGSLAFGRSDDPWIRFYNGDGKSFDSLRIGSLPRRVTAEDVRRFRSSIDATIEDDDPSAREVMRRMIRHAAIPQTWPWFADLHYDACGRLWVARAGDDRDPVTWEIYDPRRRFIGATLGPSGVVVRAVGSDGLWGTVRDSLGVVRIVRYPFVR